MNKLEQQEREIYEEVCDEIQNRINLFKKAHDRASKGFEVATIAAQIAALEALLWHFEKKI